MKILSCGVVCLVVLLAPALQGCGDTEAEELAAGDSMENAATVQLTDNDVVVVRTATEAVVKDPTDQNAIDYLVQKLEESGLKDLFDTVTEKATAEIKDDMLIVDIQMKPIRLAGGLVRLSRDRESNDGKGPIFKFKVPVLQGQPVEIKKDIMSSMVHIEGSVYVTLFCWGSFRLHINHEGHLFHMHIETMRLFDIATMTGNVTVENDATTRVYGNMKSWFSTELIDQISEEIKNAAKPFTDKIIQEEEKCKDYCSLTSGSTDLVKCGECQLNGVINSIKEWIGEAFEGASFIVSQVLKGLASIFELHECSFDTLVDPNNLDTAYVKAKLHATVLGKQVGPYEIDVNFKDLKATALAIAKKVAPGIFDEAARKR